MSARSDFITIKGLSSAKNGGNNRGVYLVKSKRSGIKYIEKRVSKTAIDSGYAEKEVCIMAQCRGSHPNMIQLLFADLDDSSLGYGSIFMQRCELGSLDTLISQYMRKSARLTDEGFLYKVLWDMSLALCFLATGASVEKTRSRASVGKTVAKVGSRWNSILHCDIKPGNVFLTWANGRPADPCAYPTAVLGDFGCSATEEHARAGAHCHGRITPCFAPPEFPLGYHERGDVYMLGLTIHCLAMMRNTPRSKSTERELHPLQGLFGDSSLKALLMNCLNHKPAKRPAPGHLPMLVMQVHGKW
ncbi:kinase-like protein, partial [Clathrospora elynae]